MLVLPQTFAFSPNQQGASCILLNSVEPRVTLKLTCQTADTEIDTMHKTLNFSTELKLKQGGLVRLNFLLCDLIIILNGQHKLRAGPNV